MKIKKEKWNHLREHEVPIKPQKVKEKYISEQRFLNLLWGEVIFSGNLMKVMGALASKMHSGHSLGI